MDSKINEIVSKLKLYKQQGLSYYQATQELKSLGYNDEEIDLAAADFTYTVVDEDSSQADESNSLDMPIEKTTSTIDSHG